MKSQSDLSLNYYVYRTLIIMYRTLHINTSQKIIYYYGNKLKLEVCLSLILDVRNFRNERSVSVLT